MPSTVTTPLLNAALVRARRLELGITERGLAKHAGLSAPTISRIEAGESSPDLNLGEVHLLAEALATEPWELLRGTGGDTVPARDDDARVEAILAHAGRLIRKEEVADALEWTLDRVSESLELIEDRLRGTGQRLHRHPDGTVAIQAAPIGLTEEERERAARAALQHRGLNLRTAGLLTDVMFAGEVEVPAGNASKVACGELANAGVLVQERGTVRLSEDAAFSLMVDVLPGLDQNS